MKIVLNATQIWIDVDSALLGGRVLMGYASLAPINFACHALKISKSVQVALITVCIEIKLTSVNLAMILSVDIVKILKMFVIIACRDMDGISITNVIVNRHVKHAEIKVLAIVRLVLMTLFFKILLTILF